MTKFGKLLIAVVCLLVISAGAVWFLLFRESSEIPEDQGVHTTVPVTPPAGNQATGKGTIDRTPRDVAEDNNIQLPPLTPPDEVEQYIGQGDDDGDDSPMVNEDGIPTPEAIKKAQESDANLYGRLVIPLAGINVRLYQTTETKVVQAEDSAILFRLNDAIVIADMWKQGFSGLQNLTKGSEMYIVTNAGSTHYLCSRSEKGKMAQGNLEYSDGSCVTDAPVGAISCYGQINSAGDIWLAEFTDTGETTSIKGEGEQSTEPVDTSTNGESEDSSSGTTSSEDDWTSGAGYQYSTQD